MSDQAVEEFLEHVGVKGMKWGVRKPRGNRDNFRTAKKPNTKGFSKDAKAAVNVRQKAKTSPVKAKALSNQEIETFLRRVNLEARFADATPSAGAKALRTVKNILGFQKTVNEISNSPASQAVKAGLDRKKPKKNPNATDIFGLKK